VLKVLQIVAEPEGVDVEESTSQGSTPKRKKVFHPTKIKLLLVYHDDELQSAGSSSESKDVSMHSSSSSSCLAK
jgi:hypothetical protein